MICLGGISTSICQLSVLTNLRLENNPDLACIPSCLKMMSVKLTTDVTIVSRPICASSQDTALCGLIAATNIGQSYSAWSCTTDGRTRTNPCDPIRGSWSSLSCENGVVTYIGLSGISGEDNMFM